MTVVESAPDLQGGPWCAQSAQDRGESLVATASRVERWLLVEHDGAWGPQSVPSSRMPVRAAKALGVAAAAGGARLLMVRRPRVAQRPGETGRWVFAVDSRTGRERVLARHVDTDAELLALDVPYDDPTDDPTDGWQVHPDPLYLVCTHGRHDRCCATRGRPVATALAATYGDQVWECSHIGGERFAANMVVLPEGHYLGWVEPQEVTDIIDALVDGELPTRHLRGRSSMSSPVQAAQAFARSELGRTRVDDLALESQESAGRDAWRVRLSGGVEVVVRYDRAGDVGRQLLTCDADEAKTSPVFRLESLTS